MSFLLCILPAPSGSARATGRLLFPQGNIKGTRGKHVARVTEGAAEVSEHPHCPQLVTGKRTGGIREGRRNENKPSAPFCADSH